MNENEKTKTKKRKRNESREKRYQFSLDSLLTLRKKESLIGKRIECSRKAI